MDDLVKRLRLGDRMDGQKVDCKHDRCNCPIMDEAAEAIEALQARVAEAERRRDEWRKKAEGYDAVRLALREKVGASWPPNMSRLLWAGIAADEKKRADDAEARVAELEAKERNWRETWEKDNRDVRYFSKAMTAQAKLASARRDAFEEAAKVADQWATDQQRQFGNDGPAAAIRALAEKG